MGADTGQSSALRRVGSAGWALWSPDDVIELVPDHRKSYVL